MNFLLVFPYLRGLVKPHLAPLTYFLLAINVFVFLSTYDAFRGADTRLDAYLSDDEYLSAQGSVFSVMVREQSSHFSHTLQELGKQAEKGDKEARKMLGSLALRNSEFMSKAETYDFKGDEITVADWREKFIDIKAIQDHHPSFQWGISKGHESWVNWISYQFAHSGAGHLFWNMLFLLFFGTFVELKLGSSFVILTYLGGGVAGAYAFSLLSGVSASPLVGASAAVSGLMGLVAFGFWKEKLTYFYWLLPIRGYYGFTLLPSWLVIVIYALPDVAGYLAAVGEFGSVAYTAHIGGTLFGLVIAGLYRFGWLESEQDENADSNGTGSDDSGASDDEDEIGRRAS